MDSPASDPVLLIVTVLGAIALVMAIPSLLVLGRARRGASRLPVPSPSPVPGSTRPPDSVPALASAPARESSPGLESATGLESAPSLESTGGPVTADEVRRIVDPALAPVRESHPWRPAASAPLPAEVLGYDASTAWTRAQSDGLVALFHLGTDVTALAAEMGLDERVLIEELARRVFGAVDPVVDITRPRRGAPWTISDREAIADVEQGACLADVARGIGRDQLDVAARLIHDGRRPARREAVR